MFYIVASFLILCFILYLFILIIGLGIQMGKISKQLEELQHVKKDVKFYQRHILRRLEVVEEKIKDYDNLDIH
jgi:hypothetical protein